MGWYSGASSASPSNHTTAKAMAPVQSSNTRSITIPVSGYGLRVTLLPMIARRRLTAVHEVLAIGLKDVAFPCRSGSDEVLRTRRTAQGCALRKTHVGIAGGFSPTSAQAHCRHTGL